jgi:uncharacterized protein YcgI (DUF1989 family)
VLHNADWSKWLPTFRVQGSAVQSSWTAVQKNWTVASLFVFVTNCDPTAAETKVMGPCMLQAQHFCSATEGTNLSPCCKEGLTRALQRERLAWRLT